MPAEHVSSLRVAELTRLVAVGEATKVPAALHALALKAIAGAPDPT
jgi:hypothetical protein